MRVCFVTIDSPVGGADGGIAAYVRTISHALVARGHNVHMVTFGKGARIWQQDGVRIHEARKPQIHWYVHRLLPHGKEWALPVREIEWSRALWTEVQKIANYERIDVIETTEMANYWRCFLKDLSPTIVRAHGNSLDIKRSYARPVLAEYLDRKLELAGMRGTAAVTAPSAFAAHSLQSELMQPRLPFHVVPNPLNSILENHARNWSRQYVNEAQVILYTGRIEYRKGTLTLLQALPQIVRGASDVKLVIAGGRHPSISEGTLAKYISSVAPANLLLLGHRSLNELIEWYKRASIFVMPSYYETFGISVIEAMAFGLPVVATTAGGLPEVIENGVTGILVEPGDSQALAEAVARLLSDPALRRRMGQAGRERVLAQYTVDKVADQTLAVYEQVQSNDTSDRCQRNA